MIGDNIILQPEITQGKDLVEEVLNLVNKARLANNIPAVIDPLIDNLTDVYKSTIVVQDVMIENKSDDDAITEAVSKLSDILQLNDTDSELSWVRNTVLNKAITHLDARIGSEDDENVLILDAYYKYLDIEPIGNIIDGDLVIQGSSLNPNYGPVLCVIEYLTNNSEQGDGVKAVGIPPWNMIYTPAFSDDSVATFSIPVSLGTDYKKGSLRVSIYVDEIAKIPYKEENLNFKISAELYICAFDYTSTDDDAILMTHGELSEDEDQVANIDDANRKVSSKSSRRSSIYRRSSVASPNDVQMDSNVPDVITDIKIVLDYDELQSCKADGYDINCIQITPEGVLHNQEFLWKFYVLVQYKPYVEGIVGVEDIKWYRCPRSIANIPSIPGYDTIIAKDLTDGSNDHAVYLAVKMGSSAYLKSLSMLSTSVDDDMMLYEYMNTDHHIGKFIQAPHDICKSMGNHSVGLLLEYISMPDMNQGEDGEGNAIDHDIPLDVPVIYDSDGNMVKFDTTNDSNASPDQRTSSRDRRKRIVTKGSTSSKGIGVSKGQSGLSSTEDFNVLFDMSEFNAKHVEDDDNDDEEKDDVYFKSSTKFSPNGVSRPSTSSSTNNMKEFLQYIQTKYDSCLQEYEKLLSENYELQKKAALYIAKEKLKQLANTAGTGPNQTIGGNLPKTAMELAQQTFIESEGLKEIMIEKQKMYESNMKSLNETRSKLTKQEEEFNQLAVDLQTRLDDKEFKATEIANSFMNFKREILSKAVNSRTGNGISHRMVKSFELAEVKRDEELEKVRLRNISLRTTLKKLEKTLRAKEQLAEGLHMMDFEQLKIENQTLNEKIEERNEELAKLKRKKTFTVQVLTHIREKLRYYSKSNEITAKELSNVDTEILSLRSVVNESKHIRDETRLDNKELKLKQGFATSAMLVQDFEKRKQTIEQTKMAIKDFQEQYSILLDQMSLENSLKSTKAPALPDGSRQGSRLDLLRGSSSRGMVVRQGSSRFGTIKQGLSLSNPNINRSFKKLENSG